jgi:hypothetical protein
MVMKELFVALAMAVVAAIAVPRLAQTTGVSPQFSAQSGPSYPEPGTGSGSETVVMRLPPVDSEH